MEWVVSSEEMDLGSYLKQNLPDIYSKRKIKRLLDAGKCVINGSIERFGKTKLVSGDRIFFIGRTSSD